MKGHGLRTVAYEIVSEFMHIRHLAELGYQFDPSRLSVHKANLFVTISEEIAKVQEQDAKRKSKR